MNKQMGQLKPAAPCLAFGCSHLYKGLLLPILIWSSDRVAEHVGDFSGTYHDTRGDVPFLVTSTPVYGEGRLPPSHLIILSEVFINLKYLLF